ncbi:MAG: zf-HC2 domain-containing protein [Clostridia bacterium]|nr:zf-HC2 domain-containing protein [Clostridia bacterium]
MAKSDCENILNLIPHYIDNMLSKEESDIVCRHIDNCASCKEEYEFLKSIMGTKLSEIEVPDGFHERLMANVKKTSKTPQKRIYLNRRIISGVAAAAVIALSVVSYLNLGNEDISQNPDDFVAPVKTEAPVSDEPVDEEPTQGRAYIAPKQSSGPLPATENVDTQESNQEEYAGEDTPIAAFFLCEEYCIIYVTVDETELIKAHEILENCEKDEIGYIAGKEKEKLLSELSSLSGYSVRTETNFDIQNEYIVIENK